MYARLPPIRCSKCGSTNASRPANSRRIEIECNDCGHFKLTREAQQRARDAEARRFKEATKWEAREGDKGPTF